MIKKILVPLDGSALAEQVLPYAKILGSSAEASIELLRVIPALPPIGLTDPAHETYKHRIMAAMTDEAQEYLDHTAIGFREMGIEPDLKVLRGEPADRIIRESDDRRDTMIAMSTHGRPVSPGGSSAASPTRYYKPPPHPY